MSEQKQEENNQAAPGAEGLERGTYEVIRGRLASQATALEERLEKLNQARRQVFGSIDTRLIGTERITTSNNCVPRDMFPIGGRFLFGYNVHIGLRSETKLGEVLAVYDLKDGSFREQPPDLISDPQFENDFKQLYKYYKDTTFAKFAKVGPHLHMIFRVGRNVTDIKSFKWLIDGERLRYVDNRSEHEFKFPPQHEFEWKRATRDMHRSGVHPHVSIEDRVFVETVGGDLTIKIEDNTTVGSGIYSEPVDDRDQTLDDAEIYFSCLEHLILLKMKPFREKKFRYFVFNEKVQKVVRLDSMESACVLLPEGHGLIFSNGYYLSTGEHKIFDSSLTDLLFETRLAASNGEDYTFGFYNRESGVTVLLSYNMIAQKVESPLVCNGYSLFPDGRLILFKAQQEPQKHHAVQIWQTPNIAPEHETVSRGDSYLGKIGNRDIVRGMAEAHEILGLIRREEPYAGIYVDLVKKSSDTIDSYFWIGHESAFNLKESLVAIRETATAAVNEFDKVLRIRRSTKQQFEKVGEQTETAFRDIQKRTFRAIEDFVTALGDLRRLRGESVALKDLKYVDLPAVQALEVRIQTKADEIAKKCVEFLLQDGALKPYDARVTAQDSRIEGISKVSEGKELEKEIAATSAELEMLIDVVSGLKIEDTTQRTRIIDGISEIYARINRTRSLSKNRIQKLMETEGAAEFSSQTKLLGQAVTNYLDVCDSPQRCDEYLTKLMVQVEELEGRFAEFDPFVVQLAEKRQEIYSAFDSRKLALVEARNKRAAALMSAAERILKGIETRVASIASVNEIHSYFAADLMIDKVRDIVRQLTELEDTVKVDDIQSRMKTIREDAVRQLKDRQELYSEGQNVIRLGRHLFSVNIQVLDLTTVLKDGEMYFHLTGTNFLEKITDPIFQGSRAVWNQDVVSESPAVYRGEYLAHSLFLELDAGALSSMSDEELGKQVQTSMSSRYTEGYTKGVHDHDARQILKILVKFHTSLGSLRFPARARALGTLFWGLWPDAEGRSLMRAKLRGSGTILKYFPRGIDQAPNLRELEERARTFATTSTLFDPSLAPAAAGFLVDELVAGDQLAIGQPAVDLYRNFTSHLERHAALDAFKGSIADLKGDPAGRFRMIREWLLAFMREPDRTWREEIADEVSSALVTGGFAERRILDRPEEEALGGLVGNHPVLSDGKYRLHFHDFTARLETYRNVTVPAFQAFHEKKKALVDQRRQDLRLEEFKPRVLSSFVRNRLIDEVYLPLIGDNLAKQMGVVGEAKRTDRMGLLLLLSPPGYGKTTLMEYIANRLGITFVKINGPAIGHRVLSLDPAEAPNASAREEVEKLNLSLEMGDNVMIYLDDIQHCNPEFLQKFISLCDGQRKIEGVYRGKTRTYDLRGKKIVVVMAGNPYTESGTRFQVPDMLANRADTYNLGDVIGDKASDFELSYLENALTSNPALNVLATRSQKDVHAVIRMAQAGPQANVELEGQYSAEELNELVITMQKLMRVRDVVLKVNECYIRSAAQSDDYRTEPAFKLQGSYRDMNKMAEGIVSIMNEAELQTLILSHYQNQAQTLTAGAESNLLKLREILGLQTTEEARRWDEIKSTFQRNTVLKSVGGDDEMAPVIAQLVSFNKSLESIRRALAEGTAELKAGRAAPVKVPEKTGPDPDMAATRQQLERAVDHIRALGEGLAGIREALKSGIPTTGGASAMGAPDPGDAAADAALLAARSAMVPATAAGSDTGHRITIVNQVPRAVMDVIRTEHDVMKAWMKFFKTSRSSSNDRSRELRDAVDEAFNQYTELIKRLERASFHV